MALDRDELNKRRREREAYRRKRQQTMYIRLGIAIAVLLACAVGLFFLIKIGLKGTPHFCFYPLRDFFCGVFPHDCSRDQAGNNGPNNQSSKEYSRQRITLDKPVLPKLKFHPQFCAKVLAFPIRHILTFPFKQKCRYKMPCV